MKKITPEVSIIIPCFNEEKSVGECVKEALGGLEGLGRLGEVIVIDNGSKDKSVTIAKKAGAKVIKEEKRGYGNALLRGINEANGEIIVMGDSDGSYDFGEVGCLIAPMVDTENLMKINAGPVRNSSRPMSSLEKARCGHSTGLPPLLPPAINGVLKRKIPDIIVGSRLKGEIEKGAMPLLNRYIGTPLLNFFLNVFFKINISDSQSGFRAFRKDAVKKLNLKSGGMEFASEMLVKAKQANLSIVEVPISYHVRIGSSKLSPMRDAWRHIRFMLLYSPTYLFFIPGLLICLFGLIGLIWLSQGPVYLLGRNFDIHTMIVFTFITSLGFQVIFLGLFAKIYAYLFFDQKDTLIEKLLHLFTLERGLVVGGILGFWGILGFFGVFGAWIKGGLGSLDAIRPILLSITILTLAVQAIFSSFFFALLGSKGER